MSPEHPDTWYEIKGYSTLDIVPFKVVSRTPKTVIVRSNWMGKEHDSRQHITENMFESLEEAQAELLKRLEGRVETAEENLVFAQQQLAKFKESL